MLTKEFISSESLRLFNQHGLPRVGVRDIAKHLGISAGNLSYHFPRKEDLVIFLAEQMMARNSAAFDAFLAMVRPQMRDYLVMIHQIHLNYHDFRGVFVDMAEVGRMIQQEKYAYRKVEAKRELLHREIAARLEKAGDLRLKDDDLEYLVALIKFHTRFWVVEAFISFRGKSKRETIRYYVSSFCRQLSAYATAKGRKAIDKFIREEL